MPSGPLVGGLNVSTPDPTVTPATVAPVPTVGPTAAGVAPGCF